MLFNTDQVIEVFVIGVGGVGGALLEQLKRQQSWLKNKHIDLRVCGVANSKALLTNVHGLNLENWQEELAQAKEPFNLGRLIRLVKEYHLLNPVIVDCTSSQAVADQYADFLREGFHVVTPNKKANLLTNVHGLNLENWQEELAQAKEPFNLGRLIRLVKEYHLLNPVIVDCTSSQAVADQYADFLREGFHVVTPNKKANTSSMDYYHQLRYAAEKSRRKFLYDTNVGAGLPVIGVNSSMTPTLGLDYRLLRTCKICSMLVMN